jgi:uncharacterized Fe-S cluster-containing radical SAM superfamily protein
MKMAKMECGQLSVGAFGTPVPTFEVIPHAADAEVGCYYVRHSGTKVVLCRCHIREFAELICSALEQQKRAVDRIDVVDVGGLSAE